jgi:hypothetical protein
VKIARRWIEKPSLRSRFFSGRSNLFIEWQIASSLKSAFRSDALIDFFQLIKVPGAKILMIASF